MPYVILDFLVAVIMAIKLGSAATKKDGDNRKARAGKLLGWIILGIITLLLILSAILIASFG